MLHCSASNIFLDTGHDDARKIIDISCPMLSKIEYQGLSRIRAFSGYDYIPSFFPERQEEMLENIIEVAGISWYICKFRDEWNVARGHCQEGLACKLYGYKKLSSIISEWSTKMYVYVKVWWSYIWEEQIM